MEKMWKDDPVAKPKFVGYNSQMLIADVQRLRPSKIGGIIEHL